MNEPRKKQAPSNEQVNEQARKETTDRAKVVASTNPGSLQRSARQLNDNFMLNDNVNLYVNSRIKNHYQILSDALNAFLAFSKIVLIFCQ